MVLSLWWLMVAGAADLCFSLSTFTSASALSTLSPQSRDGRSNLVIVPLLWSGRYKDRDIGSIPQLLCWGSVLSILKNKYVATIYGSWTESTELSSPIARKEEGLGKKVGCQLSGKDWVVCCRGNLFLILPMEWKVEVLRISKIEACCIFSPKFYKIFQNIP